MTHETLHIETTGDGVLLDVKVIPHASRDEVVGLLGCALKVKVSAAPESGKANVAVCRVIAQALKIKSRNVHVVAGRTQPHKRVNIVGVTSDAVLELLN